MKILVAICTHCGTVMTSRANHDFNTCKCGIVSVDGGYWDEEEQMHTFYRSRFNKRADYTTSVVEVDTTRQELYTDWANNINKFKWIESGA